MLLTLATRSRKGGPTDLLGRRTWARVTVKMAPRFLGPQLFVPLQPGPERGHDMGRDPPALPPFVVCFLCFPLPTALRYLATMNNEGFSK